MFKNNLKLILLNVLFVGSIILPLATSGAGFDGDSDGDWSNIITQTQQQIQNLASGGSSSNPDFKGIVNLVIKNILDPVVILLIALALVYFMWGVLTYVGRGAEGGDRTKGIQMMSYGILALFIMVSVWGLVYILINTFNLNSSSIPTPPKLK